MGRTCKKHLGQEQQVCPIYAILEGLDGAEKRGRQSLTTKIV
jgi:hypothetical protein